MDMSRLSRHRRGIAPLMLLVLSALPGGGIVHAASAVTIPSGNGTLNLASSYANTFSFVLPAGGTRSANGDAVIGGDEQTWQFANSGVITGGTSNNNADKGSGLKLGAAAAGQSTVINAGSIASQYTLGGNGPSGVQFTNGGIVHNLAGGWIEGYDGIHSDHALLQVENHGTVNSLASSGSSVYSGNGMRVTNYADGSISGKGFGINFHTNGTNALVYNYGVINTNNCAINMASGDNYAIYNAPTGNIVSGGGATVNLDGQNGYFLNEGFIQASQNGLKATTTGEGNVYVNAGTITAAQRGIYIDGDDSVIYSLGVTSGATGAVFINGDNNLLVLGSQVYLSRIDRTVTGPGSNLSGGASATGANNAIRLTESGSEDDTFTGFTRLTMAGDAWLLTSSLALSGTDPDALLVESGRLAMAGDLTVATGGITALGGALALRAGLATSDVRLYSGGALEYEGTAGNFANMAIHAGPGALFSLSRADSRLTLANTVVLDLRPGSYYGVTVGTDASTHSIMYADSFAPAEGVLLDVNAHTAWGAGISALPAGGAVYPDVVQTNQPVVIPRSMRFKGNPLLGAGLSVNADNPNNADLGLYLRDINAVYGPYLDAADVWRTSALPDRAQRLMLDAVYKRGYPLPNEMYFFQLLDGVSVLAAREARLSDWREFTSRVGTNAAAFAAPSTVPDRACEPLAFTDAAGSPARSRVWAVAGQRWASLDGKDNRLGQDYDPFALTLGVDRGFGNLTLGLAAQYDGGTVKADGGGARTEMDGAFLGAYAVYSAANWYGRAGVQFGYGWNDEETRYREWNRTTSGSYHTNLIGGDLEFGRHFFFGKPGRAFVATPHAGFAAGRLHQDAFEERGAANLTKRFAGGDYDAAEISAGLRLAVGLVFGNNGRYRIAPVADIAYARSVADAYTSGQAEFTALPGRAWRLDCVDPGRDAVRADLGVEWSVSDRFAVGASYRCEARGDYREQAAHLGFDVAF